MGGVTKRVRLIFEAKANGLLDRYEDPREILELSYEKQRELLQNVRRGVAEVATARRRLEIQMAGVQKEADKLESQARRALEVGREDLAREALRRRGLLMPQLADLQDQRAAIQADEERLVQATRTLEQRVNAFRTKKETLKATYAAAEAQSRIGEALSGISTEMGDVGAAIERAEDKTRQLQARGAALDELMLSGALPDPLGTAGNDIQTELDRLTSGFDVDNELARMKRELGGGSAEKQIEAGAEAKRPELL